MNNKPDNIVAKKIIEKLLTSKLLSENTKEEWVKKLSLGEISSEDWNLLAGLYCKNKEQKE